MIRERSCAWLSLRYSLPIPELEPDVVPLDYGELGEIRALQYGLAISPAYFEVLPKKEEGARVEHP